MNNYFGLTQRGHGSPSKTGVLLVNLGTPDAPTPQALRRYLKEFLSDPRVVEIPRLLWWFILNGIILNVRPRLRAKSYETIWTPDGSPLMVYSRTLANRLAERFTQKNDASDEQVIVDLAMCYGKPSVEGVLRAMHEKGVTRLIVLPLYPQYSGSTTGAVFDLVTTALQKFRWVPQLRFINDYHDSGGYIAAVADSIQASWAQNVDEHSVAPIKQARAEKLLISFHGVPVRYLKNGDPYHCFCHATARLIAQKLELAENDWQISFQSKFGREPWLEPATDATLKQLAADGVKSVDVVCPGFAVDCLETLEEIEIENREYFEQAGGKQFRYIKCLNDSDAHVELLEALVREHGTGWLDKDMDSDRSALEQARQRALALAAPQ